MSRWREVLRTTPMRLTLRLAALFLAISLIAFGVTWWLANSALLDATETTLKQQIEALSASDRPQDIADAVGVSKMTVSRVLRRGGGFSAETEAKVLEAAERLGYVPNRLAAAFGPAGTSTLVGVSVPRLNSALLGTMLESLNATLARLGYDTMIGAHDHLAEEEES